jgi:hypothetical protein
MNQELMTLMMVTDHFRDNENFVLQRLTIRKGKMITAIETITEQTIKDYQRLHVPLALRMTCECGKWIMCFYRVFTKDNHLVCECGRHYWFDFGNLTFYVKKYLAN